MCTWTVESDPRRSGVDALGDEPIAYDGKVVGWVTSGSYAHHSDTPTWFEQWDHKGFDGVVEVGNVFSVESFVGLRDGEEGVKLEDMILVTDSGPELLTDYPLDLA